MRVVLLLVSCLFGWLVVGLPSLAQDAALERSYRLGTGDEIQITVFGEEDLSMKATVGSSGTIPYPFLGKISVAGLSVAEVEEQIIRGLKGPYLVDPQVTVVVIGYRKFYIYGHVSKPGEYSYQPGLTVRQAVTLAGGFGERANPSKISLVPAGQSEDQKRGVALDDRIQPGDTLTVGRSFF